MRESMRNLDMGVTWLVLLAILIFAILGAHSAHRASQIKPIHVDELIVVVDSAKDAEALARVMADFITLTRDGKKKVGE